MSAVSRGPLFVLAGAPGSGKATLLPHLVKQAEGLVVVDMDETLEGGALLGVPIATLNPLRSGPRTTVCGTGFSRSSDGPVRRSSC